MASPDFLKAVAAVQKKCANAIKPADSNTLKKMLRLDSPRLSFMYGGGIKIGAVHRYIGQGYCHAEGRRAKCPVRAVPVSFP